MVLAVYAIPKFVSFRQQTNNSTVIELTAMVKAASSMVHAMAVAQGKAEDEQAKISLSNHNPKVRIRYGYALPTEKGIVRALEDDLDRNNFNLVFDASAGTVAFECKEAENPAKCRVVYQYPEVFVDGPKEPVITHELEDCS